MKGKRRLSGVLFIIAALIIMQLPVSEADAATSASDFQMEGTTLVKYRGTETNVSVPDTVEVIGEGAFEENDKVELVVVPNSVRRIDAFAFWGCDNLDTVVLGRGLTEVSDYSFANCKGLQKMSIPSNVRSIGVHAFADCVNMTDITIPPEVTAIHENAFDGCYKLYIHCEVGSCADKFAETFYQKQSEMPEYEDVPKYDDEPEFDDADSSDDGNGGNIPSNTEPENPGTLLGSTKIVGNQAVFFIDNTTTKVLGKDSTDAEPVTNIVFEKTQGSISKYTIVDGKVVADQAYYKNNTLENVILPSGIEEIGQFAFARSSLTNIEIPEGVTTVCYGAFYHADHLAEVRLPDSVEKVEPKAFIHSQWVEDFLENGTEDFLISGGVLVAYRGNAKEIAIPDGVRVIAGEAFLNHEELQKVSLPESLVSIGEGAFEGCRNLSDISMSAEVISIRDRAFAGCALRELSLPASVAELGLKALDEEVKVVYEGSKEPAVTHETSAERLSNEKYRPLTEENTQPGVTVTGVNPAFATLEGADRSYSLSVEKTAAGEPFRQAFYRRFHAYPADTETVYELQLTDNSQIPLTKLGKQMLTVILPVPETFAGENVVIFLLDRNGQLEQLPCERRMLDGVDAVQFATNYVSLFGIFGDGTGYVPGEVEELSVELLSMSAAPQDNGGISEISYFTCLKWTLAVAFLVYGTITVFWRKKG